jgi:hypothetical protein
MKSQLSFLLLGSFLANAYGAFPDVPIDGEYVRPSRNCFASASAPGGWDCEAPLEEGVSIKKRNATSYYLFAKTRGVNAHFCEYQAIARWTNNMLVAGKKDYCEVTVTFKDNDAFLSSEGDGCRDFCGARASLVAGNLKKKSGLTHHSTGPAAKSAAGR